MKALSTVPADWTLYEAELPAGAAYFAIRSYSAGAFMLMIDDVTFESGSATANLSLIGYNVWRNGEKLTAEPTGETTFTDANAPSGNNKYVVTTVYDRGESRGSNTIELNNSGVISIETGVKVKAADGNIIVTGAEGQAIVVNSVDGRTLFAGTGAARNKGCRIHRHLPCESRQRSHQAHRSINIHHCLFSRRGLRRGAAPFFINPACGRQVSKKSSKAPVVGKKLPTFALCGALWRPSTIIAFH